MRRLRAISRPLQLGLDLAWLVDVTRDLGYLHGMRCPQLGSGLALHLYDIPFQLVSRGLGVLEQARNVPRDDNRPQAGQAFRD